MNVRNLLDYVLVEKNTVYLSSKSEGGLNGALSDYIFVLNKIGLV